MTNTFVCWLLHLWRSNAQHYFVIGKRKLIVVHFLYFICSNFHDFCYIWVCLFYKHSQKVLILNVSSKTDRVYSQSTNYRSLYTRRFKKRLYLRNIFFSGNIYSVSNSFQTLHSSSSLFDKVLGCFNNFGTISPPSDSISLLKNPSDSSCSASVLY